MRLPRFGAALSVRTRLIVLAFVPVVGFAAISLSYVSSEQAVDAAFASVQQSTRLADASRVFKESLTTMQARAKDFVAQPQPTLVTRFTDAHDAAIGALGTITELSSESEKQTLTALQGRVANLKGSFAALVAEQDELGLTEFEGIQGSLRDGGNAMERIVHEDMSWLSQKDQRAILTPLMLMRRYEVEYRLTRADPIHSAFNQELANFEKAFAAMIAADDHEAAAHRPGEALHRGVQAMDREHRQDRARHRGDLRRDAPDAAGGRRDHRRRRAARQRSRRRRRGVAAADQDADHRASASRWCCIGLLLNWLIGRGITGPLARLSGAMERLATGDTSVDIPATEARDEIGAMARTVIVFRDNALEREQLAVTQEKSARERERRTETIAAMIAGFENTIEDSLGKLRGAAERLETASGALNGAADAVSAQSSAAEERVGAASTNVAAAASSAEELAASIGEIAGQAATSTEVASRAVTEAQRTVETMSQLAGRRDAHRRGDRADPGDRRPDQPAGAQRHDRGRARRRGGTRLCGGRVGGEEPRRARPPRRPRRSPRRSARSSRPPATRRRRSGRSTPSFRKCPASRRASPPPWKSRTPRSPRSRKASTAPRARRAPAPRR